MRRPSITLSVLATTVLCLASGCATLSSPDTGLQNYVSQSTSPISALPKSAGKAPDRQGVKVIVQSAKGKAEGAEIPLTQDMAVSDALEETGAYYKFRRSEVSVARNGVAGNLKVKLDSKGENVEPLYNYALRPGDQVIVKEDPKTVVDHMLQSVLRPLGLTE